MQTLTTNLPDVKNIGIKNRNCGINFNSKPIKIFASFVIYWMTLKYKKKDN